MTAKDGQAMVVAALHHRSSPPVPAGQSAKPGRGNAGPPRHRIQPAARQRPQPDLRLEPRTVVHPVRPPAARRRGDPGRRRYDGFVRKVDPDRDLIVVDLVQVFTGDAAVRAAIADGMDRDAAQVRDTYVRNQNDRLRTLEMASKVQLHLIGACESTGQEELFSTLIRTPTMATSSTTPCGFRAAWCSASTSTRPTRLLTDPGQGAARPDRAAPSHVPRTSRWSPSLGAGLFRPANVGPFLDHQPTDLAVGSPVILALIPPGTT